MYINICGNLYMANKLIDFHYVFEFQGMYCCVRGFTRRSQHYTRKHSLPILPRDSHWGYWSLQTVGLYYHTSLGGHCSHSHHCRHYIHCMPQNQPKETKRKSMTFKTYFRDVGRSESLGRHVVSDLLQSWGSGAWAAPASPLPTFLHFI